MVKVTPNYATLDEIILVLELHTHYILAGKLAEIVITVQVIVCGKAGEHEIKNLYFVEGRPTVTF